MRLIIGASDHETSEVRLIRADDPLGDQILVTTANILKANVRAADVVARYGGEEFVMLLPNTDEQGARVVAHDQSVAVGETELDRSEGAVESHAHRPTSHSPACPAGLLHPSTRLQRGPVSRLSHRSPM